MAGSYTIAEARDQLSRVVHEAENRGPVELTRRGRMVAVVLSASDYERLGLGRKPVCQVVAEAREKYRVETLDINPDELLSGARDTTPGRDFSW